MGDFSSFFIFFILILFGFGSLQASKDTILNQNENDNLNPIRVKNIIGKVLNTTLEPHTVDVFYQTLTKEQVQDLIRVSVEITDPRDVDDHKGPLLEVSVSNGRDSFILAVPVQYPNLTLYTDGKVLIPLQGADFGKKKKKGKKTRNMETNSNSQNLVITVHSRLSIPIDYSLWIKPLDRSQYIIRFKAGQSKTVEANQHLSFLKPIGYFLDTEEQHVKAFHITVISEDGICANLITVPANESLYDRRIDLEEKDNRRILSFTKRADVFLSEEEVKMFKNFRIFVLILPEDSLCYSSTNSSPKRSYKENKKVTIEFEKLESTSYSFPTLLMLVFLSTPVLIFLAPVLLARKQRSLMRMDADLINIEPEPVNQVDPVDVSIESLAPLSPEPTEITVASEMNNTPRTEDSLSIHGQMLRYPIAIILPVFMHTAVEYHKWTTSTMANRDEMCFHNHACAKPYGELRAWNNIVSNVGYAIYGAIFVAVTMLRRQRLVGLGEFGIYECTLIDVTIGVFMVLQAIASATYHICPSDVAFQFDTPCIQVICCLLIIRQWLIRIESPSAAYSNILLVAVVSLNFLISALSKTDYIRYILAMVHVCIIGAICMRKRQVLKPNAFLGFAILFAASNFVLLVLYLTSESIHLNQIVTYCCIFNCILYLGYYAVMKFVSQERISNKAKLYGFLAIGMWITAAMFFFQDDTDWTRTPAISRSMNRPCVLLDFFGSHDLWHIFGALGGLFTFLFVSFVDDDLIYTPKGSIHVF